MRWLRQSTAATVVIGPMLDDTDGKTAETALTISQADIRLSKDGGAFAQTNNAAGATHMEAGYYSVPLNTTDTNTLGRLRVAVSESGALPTWDDFMVLPAVVYDALVAGSDNLQVDAVQVEGGDATDAITAAAASALATYDPPTKAELDSGLAALNDLSASEVRDAVGLASANLDTQLAAIDDYLDTEVAAVLAAVDTEVAAIKAKTDNLPADPADASDIAAEFATVNSTLSTLAGYVDTEVAAVKAVTDKLDTAMELDGVVYRFTANALELAPDTGDATAANQTTIIGHLTDIKGATWASTDSLEAIRDRGDAAWTTATGFLDAAETRAALGMASADLDTQLSAISTKTTNLPADPADASDIAAAFSTVNGTLTTLAGYVDTEVAAILAVVDTEVAAIKVVTDRLNTGLESDGASGYQWTTLALENAPAGVGGSGDWTTGEKAQIRYRLGLDGTATVPTTGRIPGTVEGTVNDASAAADSFIGNAELSDDNDSLIGGVLVFVSGDLSGLPGRRISDWDGTSKVFTFSDPFPFAPANGDRFMVVGRIDA